MLRASFENSATVAAQRIRLQRLGDASWRRCAGSATRGFLRKSGYSKSEKSQRAVSAAAACRLRLLCFTVIQREKAVVEYRFVLTFNEAAQLRKTNAEILVGGPGCTRQPGHVIARRD